MNWLINHSEWTFPILLILAPIGVFILYRFFEWEEKITTKTINSIEKNLNSNLKNLPQNKLSIIIVLIISILLITFYWFEWRPSQVKAYCNQYTRWNENGPKVDPRSRFYDIYYKDCLHSKGL